MGFRMALGSCVLLLAYLVYAVPPGHGVPASECRSLMDLVLVVDGSDSITSDEYNKQRAAIAGLMKELHLGPNQARVGIVVYSSTIAQVINITYNLEDLTNGAKTLTHPRDGTMTSLGIRTAKELFLRDGRLNVPWVCIVITDGLSKNPQLTAEEAAEAKDIGINMFAVGISHFIQQSELEAIASDPKQVLMLKTFDQLRMSLSALMKVVCPCPPPPLLPNGIYDDGARSIGSVRTYGCEPGYQSIGDNTIECLKDSSWSPLHLSCMACPPPPQEFGFGVISEGPQTLDTKREYVCKKGYTTPEPILTVCVSGPEGPTWIEPNITCIGCPPLPEMQNGYFEPPIADVIIGTVISYQCNPGFIATGPIEATCVAKKGIPRWKTPVHKCIACGPPPTVPFADVDTKGLTLVNSVRKYTCQKGYHPTGPIEAICLGEKGATFWQLTDHSCRACDIPPKIDNAILQSKGDTLVGTVHTYVCLPGFQETGPLELICTANHGVTFWDGPEHRCVACVAPPIIPNAVLDPVGDTLLGSIRSYKCMDGYIPTGPIELGCIRGQGGPLWTSPEFHCITCPAPPVLPHAILDVKGDNYIGHQRMYTCIDGFVPSKPGPIIIECIGEYLENKGRAFWSEPSHQCIACPKPLPMEFAEVEPGDNLVGSARRYRCHKGFYATGPLEIKCLNTAEWSVPEHSCTACGPVPDVPNADVLPGPHILGTVRKYKCHKGYVPNNHPSIECLKKAKWSPVNFSCIACEYPYKMDNAVLEPGDNLVGSVRRYTCLPGYFGTGTITSTCAVPAGDIKPDWSTPVHFCKDCGEPYMVKNADPILGARTIGAKQIYKCHEGFVPSGPPVSHCMQNGEWTMPDFKCIKPIPPKVKIVYVPVPCKKPKMPPKDLLQTPKLPFPTDPSMPMKDPTFMTKESYHGNFNPNDPLSMILGDASTYMPKQSKFGVDTNGIMTSGGQFLGYPASRKNLASNFEAFLKPSYSGNDEQQSVKGYFQNVWI